MCIRHLPAEAERKRFCKLCVFRVFGFRACFRRMFFYPENYGPLPVTPLLRCSSESFWSFMKLRDFAFALKDILFMCFRHFTTRFRAFFMLFILPTSSAVNASENVFDLEVYASSLRRYGCDAHQKGYTHLGCAVLRFSNICNFSSSGKIHQRHFFQGFHTVKRITPILLQIIRDNAITTFQMKWSG